MHDVKGLKVKKTLFLLVLGFLLAAPSVPAQNKADVKLKFSKQNGEMRLVFEATETFIQKIKVTPSPSQIRLDFPELFTISGPKDLPFEMAQSDQTLFINLRDKSDIKFFRLSAPARLVLDIRTKETEASKQSPIKIDKQGEKQAEKPLEKTAVITAKVFVIDAGHGGYDFGISHGNVSEKDVSLNLAKDLGTALSKKGKKVFLIRKVDQYIPLLERIDFVNQKNPEVFISLHASLSKNFVLYSPKIEDQTANETGALYGLSAKQKKFSVKSKALSDCIEKKIKEEFKTDVIRREMPVPLINSVGAPAVLIEFPSPEVVVYDQRMKTRLVNAVMGGIALYGQ